MVKIFQVSARPGYYHIPDRHFTTRQQAEDFLSNLDGMLGGYGEVGRIHEYPLFELEDELPGIKE
jgi:hypothetical protein